MGQCWDAIHSNAYTNAVQKFDHLRSLFQLGPPSTQTSEVDKETKEKDHTHSGKSLHLDSVLS